VLDSITEAIDYDEATGRCLGLLRPHMRQAYLDAERRRRGHLGYDRYNAGCKWDFLTDCPCLTRSAD